MREIALCAAAPQKPRTGDACNGCGVCCALETCPVGRVVFFRKKGPCPALAWETGRTRYVCRLVGQPRHHMRWLPRAWCDAAGGLIARAIAAGQGCDCDVEVN